MNRLLEQELKQLALPQSLLQQALLLQLLQEQAPPQQLLSVLLGYRFPLQVHDIRHRYRALLHVLPLCRGRELHALQMEGNQVQGDGRCNPSSTVPCEYLDHLSYLLARSEDW